MLQHSPYQLYKLQHLGLSSDLMKSTVVDESLSASIQSSVWRKFNYIMLNQQNEKSSQINIYDFVQFLMIIDYLYKLYHLKYLDTL